LQNIASIQSWSSEIILFASAQVSRSGHPLWFQGAFVGVLAEPPDLVFSIASRAPARMYA
jgi:hypothetical protein